MIIKKKKCKARFLDSGLRCNELFIPRNPWQLACSEVCAINLINEKKCRDIAKQAAKDKKELREAKIKAKTRRQWVKEAQAAFNKYIRARDADLPCISCGRFHEGQYHAGHYRSTSVAPALRFNAVNVHKQCSACNTHLHGNLLEYRIGLIKRRGAQIVDWLEGPHEPAKYTIQDLQKIKHVYARLARQIGGSANV